jgi:hypothetical protein
MLIDMLKDAGKAGVTPPVPATFTASASEKRWSKPAGQGEAQRLVLWPSRPSQEEPSRLTMPPAALSIDELTPEPVISLLAAEDQGHCSGAKSHRLSYPRT